MLLLKVYSGLKITHKKVVTLKKSSYLYIKKKEMNKLYTLLLSILLFTSCAKESLEICGIITDGRATITSTGDAIFRLWIDGNPQYVTQYTYETSTIGQYLCLQ